MYPKMTDLSANVLASTVQYGTIPTVLSLLYSTYSTYYTVLSYCTYSATEFPPLQYVVYCTSTSWPLRLYVTTAFHPLL